MNKLFTNFAIVGIAAFIFISASVALGQPADGKPTMSEINDTRVAEGLDALRSLSQHAGRGQFPFSERNRIEIIRTLERVNFADDLEKVTVSNAYVEHFADFLVDKNTGMAKIFPYREDCVFGLVVRADQLEKCEGVPFFKGGGSFYSIRNSTNLVPSENWADMQFRDGNFVVGNQFNLGMIQEVIGTSLKDLTKKSAVIAELAKHKAPKQTQQFKDEKTAIEKGLRKPAAASLPAKNRSVYVLRTVAYRDPKFDQLDSRVDMIAAFEVVGREKSGALIILWKIIKSKEARELKPD